MVIYHPLCWFSSCQVINASIQFAPPGDEKAAETKRGREGEGIPFPSPFFLLLRWGICQALSLSPFPPPFQHPFPFPLPIPFEASQNQQTSIGYSPGAQTPSLPIHREPALAREGKEGTGGWRRRFNMHRPSSSCAVPPSGWKKSFHSPPPTHTLFSSSSFHIRSPHPTPIISLIHSA